MIILTFDSEMFSKKILQWYNSNQRDLPWRRTNDPYYIWLSEIILQQTRVEQGLPYYFSFTESFPTIFDLANASEDEVLKHWQGLGYYSRARNLHFTAKEIAKKYNGRFPNTYTELIKLKGIGPYTAAAISSIAFKEVIAAVDGNVQRVISRYFGIEQPVDINPGKKMVEYLAQEHISSSRPGDYNQALMDFGSFVCIPKSPKCSSCLLNEGCVAFRRNAQDKWPKKRVKVLVRERTLNYSVLVADNKLALKKRGNADIWRGLYDLPEIKHDLLSPSELHEPANQLISSQKHKLSHRILTINFFSMGYKVAPTEDLIWVSMNELSSFAVPKPIETFLQSKEFHTYISMLHNP